MKTSRILDRSAWRDPAAYDRWEKEAMALASELKRVTGQRAVPPFGRWLHQASPGWPWHYHHLKIIRQALGRVESGETNRLMIFLHPRSFKSQMVTVRYPAWLLESDPMTRIIVASYNQSLAESFSHETRRIVTERGIPLDPKRQMVDEWLTAAGGGLKAVGVGGGVTGRGANCILIDDVVKSAAEVRSAAYRERVWNWWQSDLLTRLEPHPRDGRSPSVILIMTRWSEDDIAGRILNSDGGDEWEVLRIPALAETQSERDEYNDGIRRPPGEPEPMGREPGEAMNPERFDAPALLKLQNDMGILPFMALYQQRPTTPGGDMFRREWFEIVPVLPPGPYRVVRYWDKAGTADGGAYTAGVRMVAAGDNYYVDHVILGRWAAAEREEIIRQTAAADFAQFGHDVETVVEQEPGSGGKESAENTIRSLDGYRVSADRVTGDKVVRAEPLAAQASVGRVKVVAGEWNRNYLDIMTAFPGGAIKDPVDGSSGAYAKLVQAATVTPAASRPHVVSVRDLFSP